MALSTEVQSAVDTPADFGTDKAGVAQRWISEITLAEKDHTAWRNRSRKIIKTYKGGEPNPSADVKSRRFALFWSNMETLGPAILARAPQAVVGRRFKDADPIARLASEALERSLNFSLDAIDFMGVITPLRTEYLLTGRGVAWVRYVPHMVTVNPADGDPQEDDADGQVADGAEPYDEVAWEEVVIDHVSWEDFLHNPARKWAEVRWVCRIAYLTQDELIERFGEELGKKIPLDHGDSDSKDTSDNDTQFAKAAIYEIWDKPSRKAIWISKGYADATLDERDDPLSLKDFFPCPRPVLGTTAPDSILPIPDYTYYESQCRDIDGLTRRIGMLSDALKLRGFYASGGAQKDGLADLFSDETNTLIPVDSWAAFADKGGVKGLIEWVPIDMVIQVLQGCGEIRKQLIADVYQITGIADIMRGAVDPDETATATNAKTNWGSLRVRDKQKELARFARDLLRISGEIIATKFQPQTLAEMTNLDLFMGQDDKAQAQQQLQSLEMQSQLQAQHAQMAAQQGGPPGQPGAPPQAAHPAPPPFQPPPDLVAKLQKPTWEDLSGLLRNNTLRGFRIDVETDSTIEPNDQEEKQRRIEFIQAVGEYIAKALPVFQIAPQLIPVMTEGLKFLVRGFRVGREMEDVIERALDQLQQGGAQQQKPPPGPNPQVEQMKGQAAMIGAQAKMSDAQTNQFRAQTDRMEAQAGAQLDQQRITQEAHQGNMDRQSDQQAQGNDIAADLQKAVITASERKLIRDVNDTKPMRADTP